MPSIEACNNRFLVILTPKLIFTVSARLSHEVVLCRKNDTRLVDCQKTRHGFVSPPPTIIHLAPLSLRDHQHLATNKLSSLLLIRHEQSLLICKLLLRPLIFALIRELCQPTFGVKPTHVIPSWWRVLCLLPPYGKVTNLLVFTQSWFSRFQTKIVDRLHLCRKLSIAVFFCNAVPLPDGA